MRELMAANLVRLRNTPLFWGAALHHGDFALFRIYTIYFAARLDAPEECLVMEMVDGEMVSHMEPNPKYLTGNKRAAYQFALDFLPTGQATQYVMLTDKAGEMSLYSGCIVLLTTADGLAYFRRKDIR